MDAGTGALAFQTAADFERPTAAGGENAYVVTVEVSSGAAGRVLTARQTITVVVTDADNEAPGMPAPPTVAMVSAERLAIHWSPPPNSGPPIADYDLRYRRNAGDAFRDAGHDGVDTSADVTPTTSSWSYAVQVRATNAEGTGPWSESGHATRVEVPQGFAIRPWAEGVADARSMALGPDGTLFVGTRSRGSGRLYALRDEDGDHWAERVLILANGLNTPNGIAVKGGDLYVAEIGRVLRYADIEARLADPPDPEVVTETLPTDTHHGWKFIRFGPDGDLYVPVGAPCNICAREDPYASIGKVDVTTGAFTVVARGVRNTVGFDWHPATDELWFTENGRDWMGDDRPPDELNRLSADGQHFGYPYCHGSNIQGPRLRRPPLHRLRRPGPAISVRTWRRSACASTPATCSPRGIATRSSSRSTVPGTGAARSAIASCWSDCRATSRRATSPSPPAGWRASPTGAGPVDVLVMPDGALLVSDDQGGVIYRIAYTERTQTMGEDTP